MIGINANISSYLRQIAIHFKLQITKLLLCHSRASRSIWIPVFI